jgi:hypothetical protein
VAALAQSPGPHFTLGTERPSSHARVVFLFLFSSHLSPFLSRVLHTAWCPTTKKILQAATQGDLRLPMGRRTPGPPRSRRLSSSTFPSLTRHVSRPWTTFTDTRPPPRGSRTIRPLFLISPSSLTPSLSYLHHRHPTIYTKPRTSRIMYLSTRGRTPELNQISFLQFSFRLPCPHPILFSLCLLLYDPNDFVLTRAAESPCASFSRQSLAISYALWFL